MRLFIAALIGLTLIMPLTSYGEILSRGIRTNNPGNLIKTSIQWKGEIKCKDRGFECFKNPYWGIRAMTKTLITYHNRYKLKTIPAIINRWSPREAKGNEGSTRNYIRFVTDYTSTSSGSFYDKLPVLVSSIIHFENGKSPFSKSFIREVVNDTIRDYNYARKHNTRGPNEVRLFENETKSASTYADNGSFQGPVRCEASYTGDTRWEIHLDTEVYSYCSSTVGLRITEDSGVLSRRRGSLWVDRVQSGVPVLYRWF